MVTERRRKKMKDFFEELGKYIGETATIVGNKAGEVIETQKLKSQVPPQLPTDGNPATSAWEYSPDTCSQKLPNGSFDSAASKGQR